MEHNYFEKVITTFSQPIINKYSNSNHISKKQIIDSGKKTELFHIDCKFTRKKICYCTQFKSILYNQDLELAEFLENLVNDKIEICCNTYNKKLEFKKKEDLSYTKKLMEIERLKTLNYRDMKNYLKNYDEKSLTLIEYKEIEKNINEDKKICENCKTNIYENNFHKGWKNELGEYVLLCPICSRKYFNGALEIKFENKRNDEPIQPIKSSLMAMKNYNSLDLIDGTTRTIPSFHVVSGDNLLNQKRALEKEIEYVCSDKKCSRSGKKSDFLACGKCEKYYHSTCVEPAVVLKYANRFKWFCTNCKHCQNCNEVENLTRCETCDRTYHERCLKFTKINNKSVCIDCASCKNCNKVLPLLTASMQNEFLTVKGFRVCEDCWKYYKNKHYCPKCLKIYKQQNEQFKIYCSKCLNWYHAECENLLAEDVREKSKAKIGYTCTICSHSG